MKPFYWGFRGLGYVLITVPIFAFDNLDKAHYFLACGLVFAANVAGNVEGRLKEAK